MKQNRRISTEEQRGTFLHFVAACPLGEHGLLVEWQSFKSKRSLEQNSMFHAMIGEFAAFTGSTPMAMKEHIKDEVGLKIPIELPDGSIKEVNKPTHRYKVNEMCDLVTRFEAFAAEWGYMF